MRPPASPDPAFNSKLTTALQRAKEQGLTKQGIENAMARAKVVAEGGGQTVVYEALAAGGQVALLIECNTQNASRLVKRVKELLSKNGAQTSAVSFLFEKKGSITLTPNEGEGGGGEKGFEALFDAAVEAGAEDVREVENDEGGVEYEVITTPSTLSPITQLLQPNPAYTIQSSELIFVPNEPLKVLEEGQEGQEGEGVREEVVESVGRLVDVLEEETEVEKVWTNLE
ncbi:mitochondrial protein [Cryptococcus wingfieldii CBS 7118]|uniref:Mitochondrial protein n=1 Tax=Cryptococcus wingfieldii CBS 7118 TaxID=1295528 RepID=A0A1E3IQB3_9TREE|nr:mitochondrial protein [Cryptococcus wingfieldii CBS 7118]ODN90800.1 mitochondrial protein [Cryptococcus wingfieldii CBS 7118]